MRNRDEKIDLLRELPLFAGAHRRELRELAATTDPVSAEIALPPNGRAPGWDAGIAAARGQPSIHAAAAA